MKNETYREVVGYVVAGLGDNELVQAFGDPMTVHDTREDADGQMVQLWAEGFDDHEVYELTRFTTRIAPAVDVTQIRSGGEDRPVSPVHFESDR
ncbi:hypothetical protein ACTHQY_15040 [Rhodococcoides corynebacterioides]|uniref:hypothetical protein n=1 Tax=Rhodococcoides corynebacterioides TaxID=53972 RepID=UPI003F7CE244